MGFSRPFPVAILELCARSAATASPGNRCFPGVSESTRTAILISQPQRKFAFRAFLMGVVLSTCPLGVDTAEQRMNLPLALGPIRVSVRRTIARASLVHEVGRAPDSSAAASVALDLHGWDSDLMVWMRGLAGAMAIAAAGIAAVGSDRRRAPHDAGGG